MLTHDFGLTVTKPQSGSGISPWSKEIAGPHAAVTPPLGLPARMWDGPQDQVL